MKINLYKCADDERILFKTLSEAVEFDGTIKDGGDIMRPIFLAKGNPQELAGFNYAQIEAFGRYYFVKSLTILTNSLIALSLEVDVLMSFKDTFIHNKGWIAKSENPEQWKLGKEVLDTNTTKHIQFESPFNFNGVNVMVCVNGNNNGN